MKNTFVNLAPEYRSLFAKAKVLPARATAVNLVVDRLIAVQDRYVPTELSTKVPWWVIGCLHSLEGSLNFKTHLHNGDSLTARTVNVPPGRPKKGRPPFAWTDSAIDALEYDNFTSWADWSIAGALYKMEGFNGMGSRNHGKPSAYLWSFTDIYKGGKYPRDHVWDPNVWSGQCGVAAILLTLIERKVIAPKL